jgi:hypothetical protein
MFPWLVPLAASTAGGLINSAIQNATSKSGSTGYDMPYMTPSPYDATNQQLSSQIAQQNALNAQAGRLPPGMEILLDQIRKRQLQTSKEQMYGTPGMRGGSLMDTAMSVGAQSGVGPKALNTAIVPRALNDYASRNSQINNYIDSLKFSGLQDSYAKAIPNLQSMPRSSQIPYTGQVIPMNIPGQQGMDIGLNNVNWWKAMDGVGGYNSANYI